MLDQARKGIGDAPCQPQCGQRKHQDAELFVVQDQPNLGAVETDVGKRDHVQTHRDERDENHGHEPVKGDGNDAVAL